MRIIKKLNFQKISHIDELNEIKSIYSSDIKNEYFSKEKELNDLNYFLVIEYNNILKKNQKDLNLFFDSEGNINLDSLQKEQQRVYKHLNDRNNKKDYPPYFNKLGLLNEVVGCYMIASTQRSVKNISLDAKLQAGDEFINIVIKLKNNNLPKEIETICNDHYKKQQNKIKNQINEIGKEFNFNIDEIFLINPLQFIDESPEQIIFTLNNDIFSTPENSSYEINGQSPFHSFEIKPNSKNTIENLVESHLDKINDVDFLNNIIITAETSENYELCAKIRDRLKSIQNPQ